MNEEQREEILNIIFTRTYKIGKVIAKEGEKASSFFIIKEGKVKVTKNGKEIIVLSNFH